MKYKLLLSLLVVSILACGVAVAEDKKAKVFKADLDALEAQLKGKTKIQVKQIIGAPPTRVGGDFRELWWYQWTFVDEVTEVAYKKMLVRFSGTPKKVLYCSWE